MGARRKDELRELEERLGHRFADRKWLLQALTHRSRRPEDDSGHPVLHNERLEFLGDSILGFLVSEALFRQFPERSEGTLSRVKANLVSQRHLYRVADRLELGRYLRLGPGEEKTGGRHKQAILADAVEALVAALYCDAGLPAAERFLEKFLLQEVKEKDLEPLARADYKSALQEYLQERRQPPPRYELVGTRGPEHRKSFTIELWVGGKKLGRGRGPSKKAAEQQAARRGLAQLAAGVESHRR